MRITPWISFSDRDLESFIDPEFPMISKNFVPAFDVYEKDDNVVIEVTLAGVKPENVHLAIENNVLTVHGKTEDQEETKEKNYYRKEIRAGKFSRSVELPHEIRADEAKASYKNGILRVTIPKVKSVAQKKIDIQVEKE